MRWERPTLKLDAVHSHCRVGSELDERPAGREAQPEARCCATVTVGWGRSWMTAQQGERPSPMLDASHGHCRLGSYLDERPAGRDAHLNLDACNSHCRVGSELDEHPAGREAQPEPRCSQQSQQAGVRPG